MFLKLNFEIKTKDMSTNADDEFQRAEKGNTRFCMKLTIGIGFVLAGTAIIFRKDLYDINKLGVSTNSES